MTNHGILIIGLAELCVILAAVAVALALMLKRARRHIDELRAAFKLHKTQGDQYERIIHRELQRTELRLQYLLQRDRSSAEAILVTRLRASFLTAEQHARVYRESQEEFWRAMEAGLKDLIALARLKVAQTTGNERAEWQQKLDSSEQQISELALMRGEFSAPADAPVQAQTQAEELVQLRELNAQHLAKIEKLILEVAELRSRNISAGLPPQFAGETVAARDAPPPSASLVAPSPVFIRSVQEVQYAQAALTETMQQIDIYQANSTQEVRRLKDMCLEQRSVIRKLREQLKLDHGGDGAGNGHESDQHTTALQTLLRDAEMCVQTLEQEIANLQAEITSLRDQLVGSMAMISSFQAAPLLQDSNTDIEMRLSPFREQNQKLRERIREHDQLNQLNQQMRAVIIKSFDCITANALMELLASALGQFGVHGALQIKMGGKALTATVGNGVEGKDSNLLNSVLVNQPVTPLGDDTILAFPPLKMLIKATTSAPASRLNIGLVRELAEICARQLGLVEQSDHRRDQQAIRTHLGNSIKKSLNNIKVQWKYQEEEARHVTKNMIDDVTIALSTLDLTDDEERRVLAIFEETGSRLDVLFTSGSLIEKSITRLLQRLDDPLV